VGGVSREVRGCAMDCEFVVLRKEAEGSLRRGARDGIGKITTQ
jgi:hypothetical protein